MSPFCVQLGSTSTTWVQYHRVLQRFLYFNLLTVLAFGEKPGNKLENRQCVFLEKQDIAFNRPNIYRFTFKELNFYKSTIEQLIEKSMESLSENKKVVVLSGNEENSKRKNPS